MDVLDWTFLGLVPYPSALALQYRHAQKVLNGARPCLFLLEHPPTVTLGRQAEVRHLKLSPQQYRQRGIEVFRVLRGGDVTFHGPGQLVGYPVASLDSVSCSVPQWVRGHAEACRRFLTNHGVESAWSEQHPGLWVDEKKIAAVGFHIYKRVSTHGFAINLEPDLSDFETIVPCGLYGRQVTSMAQLGREVPPIYKAARELAGIVAELFGWSLGESLEAEKNVLTVGNGATQFA